MCHRYSKYHMSTTHGCTGAWITGSIDRHSQPRGVVRDTDESPSLFRNQDGLRSGLEAAAGITGKPVPWVAAAASPRSHLDDASTSSDPPSPSARAETSDLASQRHPSAVSRGLVLPQPRVSLGRKASSRGLLGWASSLVEAVALRAIMGFLRQTVTKVRIRDLKAHVVKHHRCKRRWDCSDCGVW